MHKYFLLMSFLSLPSRHDYHDGQLACNECRNGSPNCCGKERRNYWESDVIKFPDNEDVCEQVIISFNDQDDSHGSNLSSIDTLNL